jgi:hypothetical protein
MEVGLTYTILMPWVFVILLFFNLPFAATVFRKFRMSEAQKRNHALEHGTVFYLRQRYGKKARVGGKAFESGFRLSGIQNKTDVRDAFDLLLLALQRADRQCVVSRSCGSTIIVAQGLGVVMLTSSALLATLLGFGPYASIALLAANVCAFVVLRYPLGLYIQRRFLLSLRFSYASIVEVKRVKDREFYEGPSVVFVVTEVTT